MSDDLERQLKDLPRRFPRPDEDKTRRLEHRVRERARSALPAERPGPGARRAARGLPAPVVAALAIGMATGYWVIPKEEHAVGAADPPALTIRASPSVLRVWSGPPLSVRGTIVTGRPGERVVLEENVCGGGWTEAAGTTTAGGGVWEFSESGGYFGPVANARLRAKWRGATSATVAIRVRPGLRLRKRSRNVYEVEVNAYRRLDGRRVQLQRYNRSTGRWSVARRARLVRTSYGYQTEATFRVALPRRTIIRAVLPAAQARPCYIAGYSMMETTT